MIRSRKQKDDGNKWNSKIKTRSRRQKNNDSEWNDKIEKTKEITMKAAKETRAFNFPQNELGISYYA